MGVTRRTRSFALGTIGQAWAQISSTTSPHATPVSASTAASKKTPIELQNIEVKPEPWRQIGIDLIGPLPKTSEGHVYIGVVAIMFSINNTKY